MPTTTLSVVLLPVAIIGLLSAAHWLGLTGRRYWEWCQAQLRSFAGGFSIGYVFLFLLPELLVFQSGHSKSLLMMALLGFSLFHLAHRFIFKSSTKRKELLLDEIHLLTAAMYSFLITFTLVELAAFQITGVLALTFIIATHSMLSELSMADTTKATNDFTKPVIMILTTVAGGVLSELGLLPISWSRLLFALTTGAVMYIATREELPSKGEGKSLWFTIGVSSLVGLWWVVG